MRFAQALLTVVVYYAIVLGLAWLVLKSTEDPKR